mgnify:CR=1 FL=1
MLLSEFMLLHSKEVPSPPWVSERRYARGTTKESSSKKEVSDFDDEDDCMIDSEDEIIEWRSIWGYKTSGANRF